MPENQSSQKHPSVSEHPEQRRQEETGHEDPSDPGEIGRPPSGSKEGSAGKGQKQPGHAA